jgi:hypothetical protein
MKDKKDKDYCSLFEEMLMWTSYRYCIGRKSYVSSMAHDIAVHYYDRLSPERLEFTAKDVRNEIMEHLRFLPFNFRIHRRYDTDEFNPISALMGFINEQNINSFDELSGYSNVEYDAFNKEYSFEKKTPDVNSYFDAYDIECLIGWENLAACFDKKKHKLITVAKDDDEQTVECFKSWRKKCIPIEDKPGYYMNQMFGWEDCWVPVDKFVKEYGAYSTINENYIKKIEDFPDTFSEN